MSCHLWLLPEILYHLAEHLSRHHLSRMTLVCHAWNNAFAPILWVNIDLASWKSHTSASPPPLETLQARAPWMRSLTFHNHNDPTQFSLGRECRYLRSLTLTESVPFDATRGLGKAYSDSCRQLVGQNRSSLRHLQLVRMTFATHKCAPGVPNWSLMALFAFGNHTAPRSLKVVQCRLSGQHKEACWVLCQRLEVLGMDGGWYGLPDERSRRSRRQKRKDAIVAATSTVVDEREDWITSKWFPRMIDLTFLSMSDKTSQEYLCSVVSQCPRLRKLRWKDCGLETSFIELLHEYLTNPQLRAHTWPDLESFEIPYIFEGEPIKQVTESWPIGKLYNPVTLLHMLSDSNVKILLELHSGSLWKVDLSRMTEASRKWIHRFLELCPMLEKVKCQAISIQPLVMEDRPTWVCERLQVLEMYVDMDPHSLLPPLSLDHPLEQQEEWCRKVYERLGRLRQLRVLDMRFMAVRTHYGTKFYEPKLSQLHLSLRMGLGELGKLHKLQVYFQGQQTSMRRKDVRWMVEHWINLEAIQGDAFSTRREAWAGKKGVWDWEYCRMFGEHHVKAGSGSVCYPANYLKPKEIERLAAINDEDS
ncbi:hypothetical protein BGW39_003671 [Mortierella sp. 14UC]|nr:hypothetical protein BGW39_003671 [Mortierella sp. 14UC]